MKNFDYKKYLTEGWMFKESAETFEELVKDAIEADESLNDEFRDFVEYDDPAAIRFIEQTAAEKHISFIEASVQTRNYSWKSIAKALDLYSEPEQEPDPSEYDER